MSARAVALAVLTEVERGGARAAAALSAALDRDPTISPRDRALATELVYGVLRHRGRLDHALVHHLKGGRRGLRKAHPTLRRILRIGAYQILLLDRVPDRAAVSEAVAAAKQSPVERGAALVNAVLRSLARQGEPPLPEPRADLQGHLVHALSLPPWLADAFVAWLGPEDAVAVAGALVERPPTTLRANPVVMCRDALQAELARGPDPIATEPTVHAPHGLRVISGGDPRQHAAYEAGGFALQDEASQLVAHLLAPAPSDRVLDACAGRGGKTLHLAALVGPGAPLVAMDRNPGALAQLRARAARLRLPAPRPTPVQADLAAPLPLRSETRFDAVLLDAPCSGLGVLRRNPEIKWRLTPADLEDLAARQARLLEAAAARVKPGGVLVYSVCTRNPAEGPEQVAAFLAAHPELEAEPPPGAGEEPGAQNGARVEWTPLLDSPPAAGRPAGLPPGVAVAPRPDRHDTDGFFMMRLRRA